MKASKMMMRSVLVGASAATLFLLPMRSLGIGFTILEESNRVFDGDFTPIPGLGVDYANISVSDDLIRIESGHNQTFYHQGSDGYNVLAGAQYLVTFRTDEPLAYEIQASTVRLVSGPHEGSSHNDQVVLFSTGITPQSGDLLALYGGNDSRTGAGILAAGIYTVSGSALLEYYGNPSRFPFTFTAESGYEFSLQLRPLSVPDGGTTLGLLGFGLVGMAVLQRKRIKPQV